MWYLLYKTTGIWNKKRSSYNKKRVTQVLFRKSINICCVRDCVQSNGDRRLLLLRLLKAEGFLTKKSSFAAAFSSFHPENVSPVYNVEESIAFKFTWLLTMWKEHIVTFPFSRFLPPFVFFWSVYGFFTVLHCTSTELMFLRFLLLVIYFGTILIFFPVDK